ncbi:MAG: hypothetical protein ABIK28_25070 [Planctomycetota bacterium]
MLSDPSSQPSHEDEKPLMQSPSTLEEVLDQYLQELAEGANPDRDRYLKAYPELSRSLRGLFKTLEFVENTSRTLNASRLEKGQRLGDFRIIREIGRGGGWGWCMKPRNLPLTAGLP